MEKDVHLAATTKLLQVIRSLAFLSVTFRSEYAIVIATVRWGGASIPTSILHVEGLWPL